MTAVLDAPVVPAAPAPRVRRTRRPVPPVLLRAVSPLVLLALWQLLSGTRLLPAERLAPPSAVVAAARELWASGALQDAVLVSLQRVLVGLALGLAVGTLLGLVAGFSRLGELAVDPPLQMLRTVPFLGLVPLFILWFGIGERPKVLLVALGVAFPLYLNLFAGVRGVDAKLVEAARTLGLRGAALARHVVLPGALPQVLVGLRQSLGVAWLSLIVAEQINADAGLGYLVMNAREFYRTDVIVLGLVTYALLGLLTDGLVRTLERRGLAWRRAYTP
ncbi:MAG: putative transporter integral rane subunit [Frankiales bacterium]|nr:putative transporter integral rane subunit [Frankiales bacterium]